MPEAGPARRGKRALAVYANLFATLQPVTPALHRSDELGQVDLERVEDVVRVVLGPEADLTLPRAGILDDLVRLPLGLLDDLLLGDQPRLLVARLLDDPLRLALGLGQHLLALLDDPACLLDLLGDRRAHLVEDVVDLLLVHADRPRHGDRLGVVDQIVQLVDEYEDVHGRSWFRQRATASCNRAATSSGTRAETSPPKVAISLTPLEDKKLYCGDAMR